MGALSRWQQRRIPYQTRRSYLFARVMATLAVVNLGLVAFDLSYIRFRDAYLQLLPGFTVWYGNRFKGIEPERTTVAYLELVNQFQAQADGASDLTEVSELLKALRTQSEEIVDENPFEVAGKSGTLERIKNLMRDRMNQESSKAAFRQFWDVEHLSEAGLEQELDFFNKQVRPLMETNYFRSINERGKPTDLFWQIDIWFMAIFAADFLLRTLVLSRQLPRTKWIDAMLWRLYDVPMFLGFWRWLRVVPVTLRLHQARWVNLEPLRNRLSRALVSQFAVELTEIVLLRAVDQVQQLVQTGEISRWLATASDRSRYVDVNGIDEVQTIAKRLSDVVVYRVLPRIKPELDALLQHSVVGALHQAPAYQGLKFMPGFDGLSAQISQQVVAELSKSFTEILQAVFADEKGAELTSELIAKFAETLQQEVQRAETLQEVQALVYDLLEEIKINYVDRIAEEDAEVLQASRYRLYGATQKGRT